jgi:hypothetical protein
MAHYLVYWKEYWNDVEDGDKPSPYWTTNSRAFFKSIRPKDYLWAVISGGSEAPDAWYLLGRIQVAHPEPKQWKTKWGRYHIVGAKKSTRFFSLESQPDFTAILRLLKFASSKRIKLTGRRIGQTLQSRGFRLLAESDAILLEEYARTLKPLKKSA